MVIVAGHITVEPRQRESYLAGCVSVVEQARGTAACLDFAITADLIDPGRVNIFERWESQAAVETFRGSGPSDEQGAAVLSASVAEYDIAEVRSLSGAQRQRRTARPARLGGFDPTVSRGVLRRHRRSLSVCLHRGRGQLGKIGSNLGVVDLGLAIN